MTTKKLAKEQLTREQEELLTPVHILATEWLNALRAADRSPRTIEFYHHCLTPFLRYCENSNIKTIGEIDHRLVTKFLVDLKEKHNPGGVHVFFRTIRSFLNWFYNSYDLDGNPMDRVMRPKKPGLILKPVELDVVIKMVNYAESRGDYVGFRNKAILMTLLDTGVRANELLMMDYCDIDIHSTALHVRFGKGGKSRNVYFGQKTKKAIRAYLNLRPGIKSGDPLWASQEGERLSYSGLRDIFRDYSRGAGVDQPNAHSFRRAFAINSLRNGMDVYSLQRLMGHTSLDVLRQYLDQTEGDLQSAHMHFSPVDKTLH